MAYLSFDHAGAALAPAPRPTFATPCADPVPERAPARLDAIEWSVVAIARRDRLSSLRRPGRVATALRGVFGAANPRLADERLEALRRMAVRAWHHGYAVPSSAVRDFLAHGFTLAQYELMQTSIGVAQGERGRR